MTTVTSKDDKPAAAKASDDTKASDSATSDDGNATASAKADDGKATATATVTAPKPAARAKPAAKDKAADQDGAQDDGPAYDGTTDGAERVTPGPGDSGLSARQLRAADVASAEAYAKDGIWGAPGSEVPGAKTPTAEMTQA